MTPRNPSHKRPTRHASLADQLAAIRDYIARPETVEPLQTNWETVPYSRPAAFNPEDIADMHTERRQRIRPSVPEMMERLRGVTFETIDGQTRPTGGDIERAECGAVIRLGKLRFSDGNATERAFKVTIDGKVVMFDARVPVGGMLGTSETQERVMGASGDEGDSASNRFVCDTLGVPLRGYRSGSVRRKGQNYTRSESVKMLADAIANTPIMPAVTHCPDGIACGTPRLVDQFLGVKKGRLGESGSMSWADISTSLADRDVWAASIDALKPNDKAALDALTKASGFTEVGASMGFSDRYARTVGKRAMMAANDNLAREYKKRA